MRQGNSVNCAMTSIAPRYLFQIIVIVSFIATILTSKKRSNSEAKGRGLSEFLVPIDK
jgi:hypothetical protein